MLIFKKILKFFSTYFYLLGQDKKQLPILWISVLVASLLDVAGIGLIFPLITIATRPETIQEVAFIKNYSEMLPTDAHSQIVLIFAFAFLAFFLIKSWLSARLSLFTFNFAFKQDTAMRVRLLSSFMHAEYDYHLKKDRASVINALVHNINKFSSSLLALLRLLSESIVVILIIILLLLAEPVVIYIFAVTLLIISGFYFYAIRGEAKKWGDLAVQSNQKMLKSIQESIEGLKEIRVLGVENTFIERLSEAGSLAEQSALGLMRVSILPRYFLESGFVCVIVLMVIIFKQDEGSLVKALPILALLVAACLRLLPSINTILTSVSVIRYSFPSVEQVRSDLENTFFKHTNGIYKADLSAERFEKLSLRNVSFSYPESERQILSNISIDIPRQQSIGIIGGSGAGKTTLIDLILRLLKPSAGDILVNGHHLDDDANDWWGKVAYIPQTPFLSDDTIRRNIALGVEDTLIDESRIDEAIKSAQLESFIDQLPNRKNTIIGDRGVRLSGGQRQRIAIARALYYDREVFIFDEATSALDTLTEVEIVKAIEALHQIKTVIIVAHRMSTLTHCDRIVEISNGGIKSYLN